MKKLLFLVVLTCLMCIPAAWADNYIFTYSTADKSVVATGTLLANLVIDGEYIVTGGTINTTGVGITGLVPESGVIVPNPPYAFPVGGGTTLNGLDNRFFPGDDPQLTSAGGLAFRMDSGLGLGIWANGPGNYAIFGGNWDLNQQDGGTFSSTLVSTPEPGFTGVLLLGMCGLLPLAFRRRKA